MGRRRRREAGGGLLASDSPRAGRVGSSPSRWKPSTSIFVAVFSIANPNSVTISEFDILLSGSPAIIRRGQRGWLADQIKVAEPRMPPRPVITLGRARIQVTVGGSARPLIVPRRLVWRMREGALAWHRSSAEVGMRAAMVERTERPDRAGQGQGQRTPRRCFNLTADRAL